MFNPNSSAGLFTSTSSSSTTLFDEVRSALLRNATSTLTSEAHALLQHTFAKDWDQPSLSVSISPQIDATSSSTTFLSPKALTNAISPTFGDPVDLDFGENTLDWVSSLYNKLPNNETFFDEQRLDSYRNTNYNNELNFNALRKLSISDAIEEEEEESESKDVIGSNATVIKCLQCGFSAKNRKQLWRHGKRENHITRGPAIKSEPSSAKKLITKEIHEHKCDLCSYSSKSRFNVLRHFQRVHINQKCTSCDQCDKQFKDIDTLKTHIRYTHDTERRFPCGVCEKQFVSSSDLQRHRKIVHDKIRRYLCQKCGKTFQTQSNVKRHFLEVCSVAKTTLMDTNITKKDGTVFPTYKIQLPAYEAE